MRRCATQPTPGRASTSVSDRYPRRRTRYRLRVVPRPRRRSRRRQSSNPLRRYAAPICRRSAMTPIVDPADVAAAALGRSRVASAIRLRILRRAALRRLARPRLAVLARQRSAGNPTLVDRPRRSLRPRAAPRTAARTRTSSASSFWSDGQVRLSGREFSGMRQVAGCYTHADQRTADGLHVVSSNCTPERGVATDDSWRAGQMRDGPSTATSACTQCHEQLAEPIALQAHTHHAPEFHSAATATTAT